MAQSAGITDVHSSNGVTSQSLVHQLYLFVRTHTFRLCRYLDCATVLIIRNAISVRFVFLSNTSTCAALQQYCLQHDICTAVIAVLNQQQTLTNMQQQ